MELNEMHLLLNTLQSMESRLRLEVQQVTGLMIFLQKHIDDAGKIGKEESE